VKVLAVYPIIEDSGGQNNNLSICDITQWVGINTLVAPPKGRLNRFELKFLVWVTNGAMSSVRCETKVADVVMPAKEGRLLFINHV